MQLTTTNGKNIYVNPQYIFKVEPTQNGSLISFEVEKFVLQDLQDVEVSQTPVELTELLKECLTVQLLNSNTIYLNRKYIFKIVAAENKTEIYISVRDANQKYRVYQVSNAVENLISQIPTSSSGNGGASGDYLPLAGGTMAGDIDIQTNKIKSTKEYNDGYSNVTRTLFFEEDVENDVFVFDVVHSNGSQNAESGDLKIRNTAALRIGNANDNVFGRFSPLDGWSVKVGTETKSLRLNTMQIVSSTPFSYANAIEITQDKELVHKEYVDKKTITILADIQNGVIDIDCPFTDSQTGISTKLAHLDIYFMDIAGEQILEFIHISKFASFTRSVGLYPIYTITVDSTQPQNGKCQIVFTSSPVLNYEPFGGGPPIGGGID